MSPRPRLKAPSRIFSPVPLQQRPLLVSLGPGASSQARRIDPFHSSLAINSSHRAYSSVNFQRESGLLLSGEWYYEIIKRLGKCIMFGCNPAQAQGIASLLHDITTEWRDLIAGSHGFLTAAYRGLVDQKLASGETASWGYISNANYHPFIESSRANWVTHLPGLAILDQKKADQWRKLMTPRGTSLIMRSCDASYNVHLKYPDTVSVYHKLESLPTAKNNKIIFMNCIVISHKERRVAATTKETASLFGHHEITRKMKIPPFMLEVFQEVWRQQEEEKKRTRERLLEIIARIRRFEKQTWGKKGAVEDTGASAKVNE